MLAQRRALFAAGPPQGEKRPLGGQQAAVGCAAWGRYSSNATDTGFAPSAPVSTLDATLIR